MTKSLKYYQGIGYGKINSFLRDPDFKESLLETNKDDEIVNHIHNIDSKLEYNTYQIFILEEFRDPLSPSLFNHLLA